MNRNFRRRTYVIKSPYPFLSPLSRVLPIKVLWVLAFTFFVNCSIQAQNAIQTENALPGNPQSEWDVSNAGDPTIQGFATEMSVNKGSTIRFKINVSGTNRSYTINIYRLGYYQGNGARLVASLGTFSGVIQPSPSVDPALGLVDCGNWSQSASWAVPASAVSGIYIAKLTRNNTGGSSHITFVVRDDEASSNLLFKTSDATWQAYNSYGGYSFYFGTTGNPEGRADKLSYNRPFNTRSIKAECFLFNAEYPMLRWLERNGYDMSYTTDVDMERNTTLITPSKHKVLLSVGHDEYWSAGQRNSFENARDAGVHLSFFSGNEAYWKVRWENNTRTIVCYKEGSGSQGEFTCGGNCDPLSGVWTGLWRYGCEYGEDGCRPENALTGQLSWTESNAAIQVPYEFKDLSFWRNTSIATLSPGQTATLCQSSMGYEWDYEQPEFASFNPPGRITLSSTTIAGKTHKLSLYTHNSGAIVFGAGTVQWSWGLDNQHDREEVVVSRDMQQATLNLFLDMGVAPATPQSDLIISGYSGDQVSPVSAISSPANGSGATINTPLTITGTASDNNGISRIEVSTNGGSSWQTASGTNIWSYSWTPLSTGTVTIKSRAIDIAGNIEPQGTAPSSNAINLTVSGGGSSNCPCTIFTSQLPAVSNQRDNTIGIVVGTRFQSAGNGTVTALRFYKGVGNTGTHIGQLWTSTGTLLAQATFTNETASGWQQVTLPSPVTITAGVSYIVSYHSSNGYYSVTGNFFANSASNGPLTAPADISGANNGVYKYAGSPVFPDETYGRENYYVDVVFSAAATGDVTPPVVSVVSPLSGATGVSLSAAITADFSEALDPSSVTGSSVLLSGGSGNITATVSYSSTNNRITLTPASALANGVTYTITLKGGTGGSVIRDLAGNPMPVDYVWSFTTVAAPVQNGNCPCTIFTSQLPAVSNQRDNTIGIVVGTRFQSAGNGTVTALRFYKGVGNTGTHIGQLWTSTGTLLAQATFTNETASGWQQVTLPSPVPITAGVSYIVSYHSSNGYYSVTGNFFANSASNGPLTAPADISGANNGVYKYAGSPVFPDETYGRENYYVDVVFSTAATGDVTPPVVSVVSPLSGATGVSLSAAITADFSEALDPSSVTGSSVLLSGGSGNITATVSYSSTNNRITLTPASALANGVTYTITLKGGTGGSVIRDLAGNPMPVDYVWSFTTVAAPVQNDNCPCSLFTNQLPVYANQQDNSTGIVVGTRFRSSGNGTVTAIRFYKGEGTTGTHIGQLWTSTGTLLAEATFTNETASGWQQVTLPVPVSIVAGTNYIVSYFSSDGYYSKTGNFFTTSLVNGPITAPADAPGSNNGVYKYAGSPVFPDETYGSTSYFVDVVFNAVSSPDITPPLVNVVTPAANLTGVGIGSAITALFNESLNPATVNSTSAYLQQGANSISANVVYSAATNSIVLTPSAPLSNNTVYSVTLRGGTGGITDVAGNPMAADYTWSFTTAELAIDAILPVSAISSPSNGASLPVNQPVTITGSAFDAGGLSRVEISVDGGISWQTASGTTNWSFMWTPSVAGTVTIFSRSIDNAGNIETPGTPLSGNAVSVTITIAIANPCPCTVFSATQPIQPAGSVFKNDGPALELGMKFTTTSNGYINALRFYKASGNLGTHTGQLFTATGTLLAQAIFTNETASGWQQVSLPTPVAVTAGTVYIVAYHSSDGYYSSTNNYFTATVENGPLRGLSSAESGGNGLYRYNATPVIPDGSYFSSNYWVDVDFNTVISSPLTSTGIQTIQNDALGVRQEKSELLRRAGSFQLLQNAPNPSHGLTTIKYSIPEKTEVHLALYDMQGRLVRLLVNESKAAGEHLYNMDTRNLGKGIYFYKIRADNYFAVKRLIVE